MSLRMKGQLPKSELSGPELGIPSSVIWTLNSLCVCLVAQSFPILCDPMGCSPPGSSVLGTFQAKILE